MEREFRFRFPGAGRSLLSLINDILDFSKIESGKLEIIPVEYELSSLMNDCYNMISMRAKEKNLKLVLENDKSLPKRLLGDEVRIRQVIINLLTNAVKYTKKGTVTLTVSGMRYEGSIFLLKVAVQDTGIGISEEDQENLFQSFQRMEEKKKRNIEGTGLGLAITKQLVDLMPGMNGIETLHHMEQLQVNKNRETPVIMLTANAILGAKEEYLTEGFADYLSKPVRVNELEEMLLKYLPEKCIVFEDEKQEKDAEEDTFAKRLHFLDTEMGLSYCAGSEEFYMEVIKVYLSNENSAPLQEYFEKQDWENYHIQVHAIKSTSLSIGAVEVSELAKALDIAAKEKNTVFIKAEHDGFMKKFRELLEQLQKVCG